MIQLGDRMVVSADDHLLASVRDTDHPYRSGAIGFYTEDAKARFALVSAAALPDVPAEAAPTRTPTPLHPPARTQPPTPTATRTPTRTSAHPPPFRER